MQLTQSIGFRALTPEQLLANVKHVETIRSPSESLCTLKDRLSQMHLDSAGDITIGRLLEKTPLLGIIQSITKVGRSIIVSIDMRDLEYQITERVPYAMYYNDSIENPATISYTGFNYVRTAGLVDLYYALVTKYREGPYLLSSMQSGGTRQSFVKPLTDGILQFIKDELQLRKDDTCTLTNLVKLFAKVCKAVKSYEPTIADINRVVKDFTNAYAGNQVFHMYETNQYISEHYMYMRHAVNLSSCMTKDVDNRPGLFVAADPNRLEPYHVLGDTSPCKVWTPSTEGYNNSPNARLLLVSYLAPDELAASDKYPFFGRLIAMKEDDNTYKAVRVYGSEMSKTVFTLSNKVSFVLGLDGLCVNVYIRTPSTIVMPFIDGITAGVIIEDDNMYTDDIGRHYYKAVARTKFIKPLQQYHNRYYIDTGSDRFYGKRDDDWSAEMAIIGDDGVLVANHDSLRNKKITFVRGLGYVPYKYHVLEQIDNAELRTSIVSILQEYSDVIHDNRRLVNNLAVIEKHIKHTFAGLKTTQRDN